MDMYSSALLTEARVQQLERDRQQRAGVLRAEHGAQATAAEHGLQAVLAVDDAAQERVAALPLAAARRVVHVLGGHEPGAARVAAHAGGLGDALTT